MIKSSIITIFLIFGFNFGMSNNINLDCDPLTLCCVSQQSINSNNTINVNYRWNSNNYTTVSIEYSLNNGATWLGNAGSSISPRTTTVPNVSGIKFRIIGYKNGCTPMISNIVSGINSSCIPIPNLISATRDASNPINVVVNWNISSTTLLLGYNLLAEVSQDGGTTWSTYSSPSSQNPSIGIIAFVIPNSNVVNTVFLRLRLVSGNISCSEVSNNISLSNLFIAAPSQAIGNFFSSNSPINNACSSICPTFGQTNFACYLSVGSNLIGVGTQIYIINTTTLNKVPATLANCSLFATSSSTCNRMETGIRWIRFVSNSQTIIWNVNPLTGIITGNSNILCQ